MSKIERLSDKVLQICHWDMLNFIDIFHSTVSLIKTLRLIFPRLAGYNINNKTVSLQNFVLPSSSSSYSASYIFRVCYYTLCCFNDREGYTFLICSQFSRMVLLVRRYASVNTLIIANITDTYENSTPLFLGIYSLHTPSATDP